MRIAIDPGQTTGVAWRTDDELRSLEIGGDDIVVILDGFNVGLGLSEVVYEIFRSRPGPAVNLSAPHCIGRIMAWCDANGGIPLVGQEVAAVKRRVTKDRLRGAGGWVSGSTHERDARAHLLYREEKVSGVDYWPRKNSKKFS